MDGAIRYVSNGRHPSAVCDVISFVLSCRSLYSFNDDPNTTHADVMQVFDKAIEYSLDLINQGADIIDIGGESTRPGADEISINDELKRVIPVIEGIRSNSSIPISIDTYKSEVAKEALNSGANMVNDISGLNFDSKMIDVVKDYNIPIVIMHIKGTPKNMQINPTYDNIIKEIITYFKTQINLCLDYGIPKSHIILDPGIGFGKLKNDNYLLIKVFSIFSVA